MKTQSQKRFVVIALILSLFFHSGIFMLLILYRHDVLNQHNFFDNEIIKMENVIPKEGWAETKTGASYHEAPVIFRDLVDDYGDKNTNNDDKCVNSNGESSNAECVSDQTDSLVSATILPDSVHALHNENHNGSTVQFLYDKTHVSQNSNQQLRTVSSKRKQASSLSVLERKQEFSPPVEKKIIHKKIPTLAQLAQGFVGYRDEGGTCSVKMAGNRKGMPTDEQMKYEMYLQKLSSCFQNSFTINQKSFPLHERCTVTVGIYLEINRDGTLGRSNVLQSSGNTQLDSFVLFVVRDASSSFPPLPRYLPDDPFVFSYVMTITAK